MEAEPRWEDDEYWREARITVVAAQAWHVIAELFRRYQRSHDLRVWEFHPGISVRGVLALRALPRIPAEPNPQLDFNLGGPSGSCSVNRHIDGTKGAMTASPYRFATELLRKSPSEVVDDISRLWGLPTVSKLPPSTPATLVARCIAVFLLRHSLDRRLYRASSAFLGLSMCDKVVGWVRPFLGAGPVSFDGLLGPGEVAPEPGLWGRANRYWLLHEADEAGGPVESPRVAHGVVFDMAKGTATQLLADEVGPSCDLTKLYGESKRSIDPLVDWVTGSIVG